MWQLKESVRRELAREANQLREQRNAIDNALNALEFLLSAGPLVTNSRNEKVRQDLSAHGQQVTETKHPPRLRRGSLASKVTRIIRRIPGLSAKGVAERLANQKVSVKGKSSLHDRVYRELRRMVNAGVIQRLTDGTYASLGTPIQVAVEPKANGVPVNATLSNE